MRKGLTELAFATGELLPLKTRVNVPGEFMLRASIGSSSTIAHYTGDEHPELHAALKALQLHLRSRFNLREIPRKKALADAGSVTNEQLARNAKDFFQSYDPDVIRDVARGDCAIIAKRLNIPADSTIYLYHDGTATKSGKVGFAITDRGFYCCTYEQSEFTE